MKGIFLKKTRKRKKIREIVGTNRVIWINLNYKDEKNDLTKLRPYLITSFSSSGNFFSLKLLTITSQDWKAKFKYEITISPQCFKKEVSSFVYLNNLVCMEVSKKNLKGMCYCNCKNCFSETEYNSIIALQKEFQKNNRVKNIEVNKEMFTAQIIQPAYGTPGSSKK